MSLCLDEVYKKKAFRNLQAFRTCLRTIFSIPFVEEVKACPQAERVETGHQHGAYFVLGGVKVFITRIPEHSILPGDTHEKIASPVPRLHRDPERNAKSVDSSSDRIRERKEKLGKSPPLDAKACYADYLKTTQGFTSEEVKRLFQKKFPPMCKRLSVDEKYDPEKILLGPERFLKKEEQDKIFKQRRSKPSVIDLMYRNDTKEHQGFERRQSELATHPAEFEDDIIEGTSNEASGDKKDGEKNKEDVDEENKPIKDLKSKQTIPDMRKAMQKVGKDDWEGSDEIQGIKRKQTMPDMEKAMQKVSKDDDEENDEVQGFKRKQIMPDKRKAMQKISKDVSAELSWKRAWREKRDMIMGEIKEDREEFAKFISRSCRKPEPKSGLKGGTPRHDRDGGRSPPRDGSNTRRGRERTRSTRRMELDTSGIDPDTLEQLLAAGVDLEEIEGIPRHPVQQRATRSESPLHDPLRPEFDMDVIQELVDQGFDPQLLTSPSTSEFGHLEPIISSPSSSPSPPQTPRPFHTNLRVTNPGKDFQQ